MDPAVLAMIDRAVASAIRGEASLEYLICMMVYGRPPSSDEPAWPKPAREIWSEAVTRFRIAFPGKEAAPDRKRKRTIEGPTVEAAWDAVLEWAPEVTVWWQVPQLAWPALALSLGVGSRTAHYFLHDVQGWRFVGNGKHREIAQAPCISCSEPQQVAHLNDRLCDVCHP